MSPEINILKLILEYNQWQEVSGGLSITDFPKVLQPLYSSITNFHATNEGGITLSVGDLANLAFPYETKDKEYLQEILNQISLSDAAPETTKQYISLLKEKKTLKQLSVLSYETAEGRQPRDELVGKLMAFLEDLQNSHQVDTSNDDDFVTDDLEILITNVVQQQGLRWRLETLNQMMGSLRKGDFGFIFARPETGKTTFLASEVTFMAGQLPEEAGPILWFNNEEQGGKVMLRCYQAALGVDLTQLYSDFPRHKQAFAEATHNKIKIVDSGSISKSQVDQLCRRHKPSLIIFDQIDKITGFANDRDDLKLGAIYQWARELAKLYCPVIGVSQADGTGEGQRWLTMGHVANAKTAKQAEADWILGIGKVNDPGYDQVRFLHLSKNKLMGDTDTVPDQRHGRREVLIEAQIARYRDI